MAADNSDESFTVRVHPYPSPTRASCAYEIGDQRALNAIIFIGGLHDGPHTVPYIRTVAQALHNKSDSRYSVFEIRMRSSFIGFGTSSLRRDVEDISALVTYLRGKGRRKIILFGHSTGCQVSSNCFFSAY
jgi:pimeloyl-ACP methyl ester carboxylesterase